MLNLNRVGSGLVLIKQVIKKNQSQHADWTRKKQIEKINNTKNPHSNLTRFKK